jgi:Family of unknown function (DUF5681)
VSRFVKGRSGNPGGRPRKPAVEPPSAFDVIMDRTIEVNQDGRSRELTIEEGLQLKTYQEALAGSKPARREILKMIAKREQWRAKRKPRRTAITRLLEHDPRNADAAMLILGITTRAPKWGEEDRYDRYLLEPWAVVEALRRLKAGRLSRRDLDECRRCTRDRDSIDWPEGIDP